MNKYSISDDTRVGVEIELTGLRREDTAAMIANLLNGTIEYTGGGLDRYKIHTDEAGIWNVCSDSSIYQYQGEAVEVVTPPLSRGDIKYLEAVAQMLQHNGAISDAGLQCGVHVHVSKPDLTAKALINLINLFNARLSLICKALNISDNRTRSWCKPLPGSFVRLVNYLKPGTIKALADIWYGDLAGGDSPLSHYNRSRYYALNLHSFFTGKGVEFRLYDFTKEAGFNLNRLISCVYFSTAITEAAASQRTARTVVPDTDNLKYSMRTWLTRLGFNGDEYRGLRYEFTKRLPGDPSFRYGRG